jgi:hypothetical protein
MPEVIGIDDARYASDLVSTICAEVGPGSPGTPQERQRATIIARELASHLGAENVAVEEFTFAPGAFLGAQSISTLLMVVAVVLNVSAGRFGRIPAWASAAAALTLAVTAILLFLFEFVLAREVADPLFGKRKSVNVIGTLRRPGAGDIKRLLILSGHHDSAVEFNWLRWTRYGYFFLTATWLIGLVTVLVMSAIQLAGALTHHADLLGLGTLGWVLIAFAVVPSILYTVFFTWGARDGGTVPGAVDNLSACALAVAMCRCLVQNPSLIPNGTEIRFITFGSEEAGCRGSRRYVARHLDELKRLDAQLLNAEMVAYPEIGILTSETNGSVRNSPAMVRSVITAAQRAGVPYRVKPATLGTSSDAGPFSRAGLKATTLMPFKWPQQMVAIYHQRTDTPEVLTIEPLENVLKLSLEWIGCGGEDSNHPQ